MTQEFNMNKHELHEIYKKWVHVINTQGLNFVQQKEHISAFKD